MGTPLTFSKHWIVTGLQKCFSHSFLMLLSYIFVSLFLFSNKGLGSVKEKKLKQAIKKNGLTVPGETVNKELCISSTWYIIPSVNT